MTRLQLDPPAARTLLVLALLVAACAALLLPAATCFAATTDLAPVVTAPASASGITGQPLTVTVTAADPDGDPIVSLTVTPLPAGATFTTGAGNTSGTLAWTPVASDAGAYNVTFTATNALSGSAMTVIFVSPGGDASPVVTAPATKTAMETVLLTFPVYATDADGAPIATLTAAPLPAGATFSVDGTNTSGTFSWTPSLTQAGAYYVTFTACNALCGSAVTYILVQGYDPAPVPNAPASVSAQEMAPVTFTVTASDPNGGTISSFVAAPLPAGATFSVNPSKTSGTFNWTPTFTQSGTYSVTFTACSGFCGSATTQIVVANVDLPPVVSVPISVSGEAGTLIHFDAYASDPDGDPILSFGMVGGPPRAQFVPDPGNGHATFNWTPTAAEVGSWLATFVASNVLVASGTTVITVLPADKAPVVTAPSTQSGELGVLLVFGVSATDPDGDAITSLTAAPLPAGATFTPDASNTHGTFMWTPDFSQAGSYPITFTACNALCGSAVTTIAVQYPTRPPTVIAPGGASTSEGVALTFDVAATDAGGGRVALTAPGLPPGATFVDHGNNTGTFAWTPDYSQAGDYTILFVGTVAGGVSSTATTAVHVANTNRAPVAEAGGPYTGFINVPVTLDGSQSSDPDGDPLAFSWEFGDGNSGFGAVVAHTYVTSASYLAHLTVADPAGLTGADSVFVQVTGSTCGAMVFTEGGNKIIRLNSGRPTWCAQFQPYPGCFPIELIDLSSFEMVGERTIHAITDKTIVKSDRNGDGAPEITVCFAKEDLQTFFAGLPAGETMADVTIQAAAVYGSQVFGYCRVRVFSTGGMLAATVTPNPLRPSGQLQFTTARPGALRVRLFDVHGRLVRTLLDEAAAGAGSHGINIDGRDGAGAALSAGIYFYRIETPEAQETGRLVIAR